MTTYVAAMAVVPATTNVIGTDDGDMSGQRENQELKRLLTRLKNEYQELQDDSKFHQAKNFELTEILMQRAGKQGQSTPQELLIAKTAEMAELKLQNERLRAQLKDAKDEVHTMSREKQGNNRLLLEMSDIVRTLQSVQISYDATDMGNSNGDQPISAQHASVQKVKKKIESIMSDRALLVRRCKELELENGDQQHKIKAFEAQFHLLNSMNLIKGGGEKDNGNGSNTDTAPLSSSFSISTKSSPVAAHYDSGHVSPLSHPSPSRRIARRISRNKKVVKYDGNGDDTSIGNDSMHSGVSLIERQVFEQRLQEQEDRHNEAVQQLCEEQEEQVQQAQAEYDSVYQQLQALKVKMEITKERMEDAVIKRDEYKENLRDIISQYKELHSQHQTTTARIQSLESQIQSMQREMVQREEQIAKQQKQEARIEVDQKWMPWSPKESQEAASESSAPVEEPNKMPLIDKEADEHEDTKTATTLKTIEEVVSEEMDREDDTGIVEPSKEEDGKKRNQDDEAVSKSTCEDKNTESGMSATMQDLLTAYGRAMDKIETLEEQLKLAKEDEARLLETNEDRKYRDAVHRYKKLKQELDGYKLKLIETESLAQKAKQEAQKEREEAKHARRRLTSYIQKDPTEMTSNTTSSQVGKRCTRPTILSIPTLGNVVVAPKNGGSSSSSTAGASPELKALLQKRDALINAEQQVKKANVDLKNVCEERLDEVNGAEKVAVKDKEKKQLTGQPH